MEGVMTDLRYLPQRIRKHQQSDKQMNIVSDISLLGEVIKPFWYMEDPTH